MSKTSRYKKGQRAKQSREGTRSNNLCIYLKTKILVKCPHLSVESPRPLGVEVGRPRCIGIPTGKVSIYIIVYPRVYLYAPILLRSPFNIFTTLGLRRNLAPPYRTYICCKLLYVTRNMLLRHTIEGKLRWFDCIWKWEGSVTYISLSWWYKIKFEQA